MAIKLICTSAVPTDIQFSPQTRLRGGGGGGETCSSWYSPQLTYYVLVPINYNL